MTCLGSASRLLACTLAYGRRGLQALQARVLVGEVTRCPRRLQTHSLMKRRYWYEAGMDDIYMKELAAFAAFQNHLKTNLAIDAAAHHWRPLSIAKQQGVNAVGVCCSTAAMLYISAEGSVCDKTVPSHAAFALAFIVADATWSAEWISTASGLPLGPAFSITARDGRGITGLQTPALQPDAVLVLKAIP